MPLLCAKATVQQKHPSMSGLLKRLCPAFFDYSPKESPKKSNENWLVSILCKKLFSLKIKNFPIFFIPHIFHCKPMLEELIENDFQILCLHKVLQIDINGYLDK